MVIQYFDKTLTGMAEQDSSQHTILIPDDICDRAGLTLQWCGIGQFGIHAYNHVNFGSSNDEPSGFAPIKAKVHQVRPDSILFEPVIRKLVNEACGTFLSGQKLTPSKTSRPETLKLSRQYRSILRACIENLQMTDELLTTDKKQDYIAIFYNIELIWHLCEILYVDAVPGNVVLPYLLEWIRFHFPDTERAAGRILTGLLDPGAELRYNDYWDVVIGLIMQGSVEVARALLRLHSDADKNVFLQAESVLRTLPVYTIYGGLSTAEFKTRWHTWQTNVTSKIEAGVFSSSPQLTVIMKIVSGDDGIIDEMKSHCDTWYQLMVAVLLYTDPTIKSFDLSFNSNLCIEAFGGSDRLKLLDETILAVLECNILEVIKKLHFMSDSGWCATHLTNLLYYCGQFDIKDKQESCRLDEHLIIEYGSLLMSHNSLWQVGVRYLDHCPTQGRACLELLLPRLKRGSESRTLKIIQIAADRDLPDIVNSICKVEGMRCLQRKRVGQALCWALKSQDPGFATYIADSLLHHYTQEGSFHSLDLLDNLGSCMLISDRLTFLASG
ncbi:nuclear pore complex protein Nup85-like isoform X2 [Lycorma delicatula]|uniref:nuclear pore complex protein Nup85-like isoform X2 n=1 Tax=Lycorma delicatula TaxID=130591 RepID=UPI003F518213